MTDSEYSSQDGLLSKGLARVKPTFFSNFKSPGRIALIYLVALALAEATTTLVEPRLGMVMHGLVLGVMLLHSSLWAGGNQRRFLLALALAPLIRLLSLSLPLPDYPFVYWYMVVGIPLFLAAYVAARAGRMSPGMLGLTWHKWQVQILIGATGAVFAYVEYLILKPKPLVTVLQLDQLLIPGLILLIFTGFLEELVFRGMMQYAAIRSFGRVGLIYVAVIFSILHFGYFSVLDVAFVLGVGLFFGWVTFKTGSILGVTLSHGLTNMGLYLVIPFLLAAPAAAPGGVTPVMPLNSFPTPLVTQSSTQSWITPSSVISIAVTATITPQVSSSSTPTATSTSTPTLAKSVTSSVSPTISPTTATPTSTPCRPPAGWRPYTVQTGDTLSSLSFRTNFTVQALMQGNCLSSKMIYVGQRLYLPVSLPSATFFFTITPTDRPSTPRPEPSKTPTVTVTTTASPSPEPSETPTVIVTTTASPSPEPSETPTATMIPADTQTPTPTLVLQIDTPTATSTLEPNFQHLFSP